MAEEAEKREEIPPYVPKTDDELNELAIALIDNQVFTDRHIPEDFRDVVSLSHVFLNIALSGPELDAWMRDQDITMVYEFMKDAGPRGFALNNSPTFPNFFSCKFLNSSDQKRVAEVMKKLMSAMGIEVKETEDTDEAEAEQ